MPTGRAGGNDGTRMPELTKPVISVLGYALAAVMLWIVSMMISRRIPGSFTPLATGMILSSSGVILAILGLMARRKASDQDTIIFWGLSLLFLSISTVLFILEITYGNSSLLRYRTFDFPLIKSDYIGWFNLVWGVIFGCLSIFCRASGMTRILFLGLLSAGAFNVAVAGWAQLLIFRKVGACFFLIAAICSGLNAVSSFILLKLKKPIP